MFNNIATSGCERNDGGQQDHGNDDRGCYAKLAVLLRFLDADSLQHYC